MNLEGNTILISGGSSGIGFEMAKEFLKRNNKVIITGRNEQKLENAKAQLDGVTAIRSDVSNSDDINMLYQEVASNFPDLNIVINNAGTMSTINLQDHKLSAAELTTEFDVNVKGTVWVNDAFLPLLKGKENAATITVSSGLAFFPLAITPIYSATKAALHSYTLCLREQFRNTSIKVFELAPPPTQTGALAVAMKDYTTPMAAIPVEAVITSFLKGLSEDQYEIRPGITPRMKIVSTLFPKLILKQMSKTVDIMHAGQSKARDLAKRRDLFRN